jgi:hypothetical protein
MGHLLVRNAAYAQAHGFEHHFFNEATVDLPVYWQKVYLCRQVLAAGYDIAIWADTDAVFHDFGRGVESLFQGDEVMVGAPDNPYWDAPFNAGVFAVRGWYRSDGPLAWAVSRHSLDPHRDRLGLHERMGRHRFRTGCLQRAPI